MYVLIQLRYRDLGHRHGNGFDLMGKNKTKNKPIRVFIDNRGDCKVGLGQKR